MLKKGWEKQPGAGSGSSISSALALVYLQALFAVEQTREAAGRCRPAAGKRCTPPGKVSAEQTPVPTHVQTASDFGIPSCYRCDRGLFGTELDWEFEA